MLVNKSKNIIVKTNVTIARHWTRRLLGWMFKKIGENEALVISPCQGIHTCFMRSPIDVIALSDKGIVQAIYENLSPWRVTPINRQWHYVIEIQGGSLNNKAIIGDHITFSEDIIKQ